MNPTTQIQPAPIQTEKKGLAIAAIILAGFSLLLSAPFLLFFTIPYTGPSEYAWGTGVLALMGFLAGLLIVIPALILSVIFSIIVIVKSKSTARILGLVAAGCCALTVATLIGMLVLFNAASS